MLIPGMALLFGLFSMTSQAVADEKEASGKKPIGAQGMAGPPPVPAMDGSSKEPAPGLVGPNSGQVQMQDFHIKGEQGNLAGVVAPIDHKIVGPTDHKIVGPSDIKGDMFHKGSPAGAIAPIDIKGSAAFDVFHKGEIKGAGNPTEYLKIKMEDIFASSSQHKGGESKAAPPAFIKGETQGILVSSHKGQTPEAIGSHKGETQGIIDDNIKGTAESSQIKGNR